MYKGNRYWEAETPHEAQTKRVWISYFPKAGRLQLASIWRDEDGPHRGKTVTLAIEDIQECSEARMLLTQFLNAIEFPQEATHDA